MSSVWEVIRFRMRSREWDPNDEISALIKRDTGELGLAVSLTCGDTARRWSSASQEERPHQKLTMLAP